MQRVSNGIAWEQIRRGYGRFAPDLIVAGEHRGGSGRASSGDLDASEEADLWAVRAPTSKWAAARRWVSSAETGPGSRTLLRVLARITGRRRRLANPGRVGALIEVAAGFHPELTGGRRFPAAAPIMGMKRAEIAPKLRRNHRVRRRRRFVHTQVKRYSSGMNGYGSVRRRRAPRSGLVLVDEVLA